MELRVGAVDVHYVEHGSGTPVVILHGAGVDHREPEACFEPLLRDQSGLRRLYPDLPGTGRTAAPATLASADDVLDVLVGFVEHLGQPVLLAGHSAGGYYARCLAIRRPDLVAGLALVCPLLDDLRDVPDHHPVVAAPELGDEEFRGYFVLQTPAMLDRYERFVAPAVPLADDAAAERIGKNWRLDLPGAGFDGPSLVVAGRQDSIVGYAAALDLAPQLPRATVAVLDGAGHALPHELPEQLGGLVRDWVSRCGARIAGD